MAYHKIPSLTADIFIFDEDFNFILIKRKNDPYKDYWALPGGFVEYGESVEDLIESSTLKIACLSTRLLSFKYITICSI